MTKKFKIYILVFLTLWLLTGCAKLSVNPANPSPAQTEEDTESLETSAPQSTNEVPTPSADTATPTPSQAPPPAKEPTPTPTQVPPVITNEEKAEKIIYDMTL